MHVDFHNKCGHSSPALVELGKKIMPLNPTSPVRLLVLSLQQ
jgi:hypothetical protein